ncbi:ABC transporter substrate-binding protein [Paenibacillus xylaniclasticus]|uniref:ABC transporter substrate-binding protein n=1 Tax=Paenibacillus xylaniclasticus TaxID=588083 RepID=UPI0017795C8F|nr:MULTISPECIES: ABC transporter substrate-binding protein [Paenibacillus]GFN33491.1 ABC transporter substrate-binding protein [Paenibacillus curdlanolyticus]
MTNQQSEKKKMNVKVKLLGVLTLLIALTSVLAACGSNDKESSGASDGASGMKSSVPSVLNYGYIGSNELNLPGGAEGWGLYKGIIQEELKKYGINEVKVTGFPNGPDQTESLISGRLDVGGLGDTPAIIARASGAKTKLVNQNSISSVGYLISAPNGPTTIEELKGKTIAIQKGSFMHRYIAGLLKEAGITDYKFVHMLIPDGQAALARGDVDAMGNTGYTAQKLLSEGYTLIDESSQHPDLLGTGATVVSESFLAKFPDFPKVWNEARKKALADLKQHEDEYYQFIADLNKTTVDLAKKVSPISHNEEEPFTEAGLARIKGTKDFLVEEGLAKNDFEIEDWLAKSE